MDDDNVIDFNDPRFKKYRNLRGYKNYTDEEIIQVIKEKEGQVQVRTKPPVAKKPKEPEDAYEKKFNSKLKQLRDEYSVDMNNSNDAENLKNLVRQQIQLENVTRDIDAIQAKDSLSADDYQKLEKLGKFQAGVLNAIGTLEEKLGISRRHRKEKQVDDLSKYIHDLKVRAKDYFEKMTIKVECEKCKITLAQFWLNFPNLQNEIDLNLQCYNCKESVLFSR